MDRSKTIRLDLPAAYTYLPVLGSCVSTILEDVQGEKVADTVIHSVELAVHETCMNIIEHAYAGRPGRINLVFSLQNRPPRLIVDIRDTGRSFELKEIQEPNLVEPQTSGYGLFLVHQLIDEVVYERQAEHNHWRLVKNL